MKTILKIIKLIFFNLLVLPAFLLWLFFDFIYPIQFIEKEIDRLNGVEREPRK